MKRLFTESAEAFVLWLAGDAKFIRLVPTTLEAEDIHTDILGEIRINDRETLLHVEFQKKRDSNMGKRLWEYNVRATLKYDYPVWSCVLYLTRDSTVENFYCKTLPNGQPVHRFDFSVIKMWEVPTQELLDSRLRDLAPLLVLTREGQRREVVETAIALLDPPDGERKGELLTLTYGLASLILTNEADQDWLARRFGMLYDILKDTRAFQDLAKEVQEESLQQGMQQGKVEGLRLSVLDVVEARFASSELAEQARAVVERINDLETLRQLVVKIALLQESGEVLPLLTQAASTSQPASKPIRKRTSRTHSSRKKHVE